MEILYGKELATELREASDSIKSRLWVAVPFIGGLESVKRILGRVWIDKPDISIRLLTDLNELNNFNSETIKQFGRLGEIRHLEGLHAKIFITDNSCLLTSANLTNTAFAKRYEIGAFLDVASSKKAIDIFKKWWGIAEKVPFQKLKHRFKKKQISAEDLSGVSLRTLWELPDKPEEVTYWLKPIGVSDSPITEDRDFSKVTDYLHFATPSRIPRVQIGDILIEYGVGARRVLSIYQATSLPMRVTKKDIRKNKRLKRWPWYVVGKNLTPKFGGAWQTHNLYASQLIDEYLAKYSNGVITKNGSKNLNALMRGKDKIKLDPDFAKYVIRKVMRINDKV